MKMRRMVTHSQTGFGGKITAINKIWELKLRDCEYSFEFAFKHWRNKTKFNRKVKRALYRLVVRQQSNRLRYYYNIFVNYSVTAGHAMREHCLALNFADEQTKLISYGQLVIRSADVKTKRLIKLGHLFKAWRDSIAYRKFLMSANV